MRKYLNDLSKLTEEDLNKDDEDFAIHNNNLPVVSLRVSVAVVEEAELCFGIDLMQLIPLLVNKEPSYAWNSQAPNDQSG